MTKLELNLPYPPTANLIWRMGNGRVFVSTAYERFKKDVAAALVAASASSLPASATYAVAISLFPSDRRRRDADNAVKPLFDAITKSGLVWRDDSQVVAFSVIKGAPAKNAFVRVQITSGDCLAIPSPAECGEEAKETRKRK